MIAACAVEPDGAEQFVHLHPLLLSFDGHPVQQAETVCPAGLLHDRFAGDDRRSVLFIQPFQTRGEIHAVAQGGVAKTIGRAEVADHDAIVMQAEARGPGGQALP